MKNVIDHSKDETASQQPCSEKKCATCFANRGCMYEQHPASDLPSIERYYGEINADNTELISKRA